MTDYNSPEWFAVRVKAARISMQIAESLGRPSPDWIIALVREGDRREREAAAAS